MRILIAIVLLCSPAIGQELRITERSAFRVTERQQFVVHDRDTITDYVLIVKVRGCGPCIRMEKLEVPRLRQRGVGVVVLDAENLPAGMIWRHTAGPSVTIIDGNSRKSKRDWIGYTSADVILRAMGLAAIGQSGDTAACSCSAACTSGCQAGEPCKCSVKPAAVRTITTVSQSRNPSLFGRRGTSHESRESLIEHLLSGAIHRGRWRPETLIVMSDNELNAVHNQDHGWR